LDECQSRGYRDAVHGEPASTHGEEHAIHLPPPSFSPPVLGLGVMLLSFGILYSVVLIAIGGLIMIVGIATWLIDDARAYVKAGDPSDEHGGH
jgi:hypothetical protein